MKSRQESLPNQRSSSPDELNLESQKRIKVENQTLINTNPLHQRCFTNVSQTSTSIQVAWSHPQNFQKLLSSKNQDGSFIAQKQHIQYVLEYGIGVKVDNKEQFRQIYKGKAHKCIITDLMPRTTFRLRVSPILHIEMELLEGENVKGTPASLQCPKDLKDKKKIYR